MDILLQAICLSNCFANYGFNGYNELIIIKKNPQPINKIIICDWFEEIFMPFFVLLELNFFSLRKYIYIYVGIHKNTRTLNASKIEFLLFAAQPFIKHAKFFHFMSYGWLTGMGNVYTDTYITSCAFQVHFNGKISMYTLRS